VALAVGAIVYLRRAELPAGHVHVTGSFQYEDGSPVAGLVGVVRFDPEETYESGVRGACTGNLRSNGRFDLMTREAGDGVAIGAYRVVLLARNEDGSPPEKIHDDYTHFETTPWRAQVTPAGPNDFTFVLDDPSRRPTTEYQPTRRPW
jgi:hypothetical protein